MPGKIQCEAGLVIRNVLSGTDYGISPSQLSSSSAQEDSHQCSHHCVSAAAAAY